MIKEESKVLVGLQNYVEIKQMLISEDQGSRLVGTSILDNANYKKSKFFILTMLLEVSQIKAAQSYDIDFIKNECPNLYLKILDDEDIFQIENLSFRSLYLLIKRKGTKKDMGFLLNVCKDTLKTFLIEYGFDFLEYFELDIKEK
jgi:hypothetical protein